MDDKIQELEKLDLRDNDVKDVTWEHAQEVHDHSKLWANIAKPFAWFIFALVSIVIIVPFVIITINSIVTKTDHVDMVMQWSTTVLAPIVGFGSAVVGYYFGASGSNKKSK